MCGIVGAAAQRDVADILLEGLKRLEYRGYDSAGIAIIDSQGQQIERMRVTGKVNKLAEQLQQHPLTGHIGIAHTRWATHGMPCKDNAHPHISGEDIAVVHNGIIENHTVLRNKLTQLGYEFCSQTDTEVIAHLIHYHYAHCKNLLSAVQAAVKELEGAYALSILHQAHPDTIIGVRCGSPLVLGLGIGEHFLASDALALLPVTHKFIYLEEGDIALLTAHHYEIFDAKAHPADRNISTLELDAHSVDRGHYRHFMLKEIFEQPNAINETLEGRLTDYNVGEYTFGVNSSTLLTNTKRIHIVACGTSYHAGLVAKYWLENILKLSCQVEIASEYRYREVIVEPGTLFITISQSGETADTLAALQKAKQLDYLTTLTICNVAHSSLVRESAHALMTRAGVEIGVASTKAFTTQLTALLLLIAALGQQQQLAKEKVNTIVYQLKTLPKKIEAVLSLDATISQLAKKLIEKQHALFLGRGIEYPIALEGALKMKEISYIHAEAYPAGELKHGPLALIDKMMPVIAIAANDALFGKVKSNLHEVQTRGGQLMIFTDCPAEFHQDAQTDIVTLPAIDSITAPIIYTIPLQLLAYHIAVLKGTDIDQPRNLAKSVTVE